MNLTREQIEKVRELMCAPHSPVVLLKLLHAIPALCDMAEKLLKARKFCYDDYTTHCYTDEAQIGYDTAKTLVLQIIDEEETGGA